VKSKFKDIVLVVWYILEDICMNFLFSIIFYLFYNSIVVIMIIPIHGSSTFLKFLGIYDFIYLFYNSIVVTMIMPIHGYSTFLKATHICNIFKYIYKFK
jgi:hypothetical protein